MKNLFIFSILGLFCFSFTFFSHTAFAATASPIATVNIQDAQIVSQNGNDLTVSFTLSNREGMQTGVKYGIQLVSETKAQRSIVDEKVYDESLTLNENSSFKKEITYTTPSYLNGDYSLFVTSRNASGFPFGVAFAGKITFSSSVKSFDIVEDSCYLKVEGEKSNTRYGLLEGVDISQEETLRLTCSTMNNSPSALSLSPSFETRYRSSYGEIVPVAGGDTMPIAFKALKKENFSILLPKATAPQLYDLKVLLANGQTFSNAVTIRYFIRGTSATIQNLTLDKDYYTAGETASLSLVWTQSGNTFLRNSTTAFTKPPVVFLTTTISDSKDNACVDPAKQTLVRNPAQSKTIVTIPVTAPCRDPHINLVVADESGTILDQKEFSFTTKDEPMEPQSSHNARLWLIVGVVFLTIIIFIYMKKRNSAKDTTTIVRAVLPFFLFAAMGVMFSSHTAFADTYASGINGEILSTVSINNGSPYAPGDTITVTSSIVSNATVPRRVNLKATTIGNATLTLIPDQEIGAGGMVPTVYDAFAAPGAPSSPGSYLVSFVTGVDEVAQGIYVKITSTTAVGAIPMRTNANGVCPQGYGIGDGSYGGDTFTGAWQNYAYEHVTETADFYSDPDATTPLDVGGLGFRLLQGKVSDEGGISSESPTPIGGGTSYTYQGRSFDESYTDQYGFSSCDKQLHYSGYVTLDGTSAPVPYVLLP
ncbi:MAG: hypothetical protein V4665_03735 [Patescibacteria group bacterium]